MIPAPSRRPLALYALLALPFLVNDLANIFIDDFATWLLIDYAGVKALPLAVIALCLARGRLTRNDLGLRPVAPGRFVVHFLVLAAAGTALDQWAYGPVETMVNALIPGTRLGSIPFENSGILYWYDLLAGLALVALVEELVFRGLALSALKSLDWGTGAQLAASGLIFGLIHWSSGVPAVIITGAIGTLFMCSVMRTGSIWPPVAAHFVVNFVDFSGIFAI